MKTTVCTSILAALMASAFLSASQAPDAPEVDDGQRAAGDAGSAAPTPRKVGRPSFMSPHASPIAVHGGRVFVVNTPADTVDVIDRDTRRITARVPVGVDPVSLAVRPDGKEVWVSNHVSDSVSVIDTDPGSPTHLHVVATVQDFDSKTKATRFDEPVGVAFAGNHKAYVALSSENTIGVVDVASRRVTKRLTITAQDPRAIVVRRNRLYVIPFESNNQTQLSGGSKIDGDLVTFNAWEHSIRVNNVLSLGHVVDIVKHPKVPDRDLYVFDIETDELIETVDTLGTLLYGLAVDSEGRVFIAQTDARNEVNGRSGSKKHGLKEMGNRAFLNRITRVAFNDRSAKAPRLFDLEPLPPKDPAEGEALATPFAIQVTSDDSTLVVTAAGSDKLFTVDASSGVVLGRTDVGAVPRGVALEEGAGKQAWVLNAVANTVSVIDVSDVTKPKATATIALEDPTHPAVKRGRIAFNTASASTSQTFSCASCHPDGHTDQLLWVLQTPIVTGGDQIMPRSTMPIRGLRDTEPYHWDGIPGDPYGGINSASIRAHVPPNSRRDDPTSSTRHLIDAGLATTMMRVGDKTVNDEGKPGELSAAQRDDLAKLLLAVPYPPAQRRAYDNAVTERARQGFKLFHIDGDLDPTKARPNVCGDCHRMPFWVSTNTPGTGMDAPTWRGAYDRFLILPQGRLNIIDFDFYAREAERGIPERAVWRFSWAGRPRFDPVWDMVLQGSTGFSGSFARQVTLNRQSAGDALTGDLLDALEQSAGEGAVVLEAEGVLTGGKAPRPLALQYHLTDRGGRFVQKSGNRNSFSREDLIALAAAGRFVGTFTARHGALGDYDHPQPGIWTLGPIEQQRGRQQFPVLHGGKQAMTVSGRHIDPGAHVYVNGRRVEGDVVLGDEERVVITLSALPPEGMHLLQLQNADGMFTNDFIFHVVKDAAAAGQLRKRADRAYADPRAELADAIAANDLAKVKRVLGDGKRINARRPDGGATPLSTAALHGRVEITKYLIQRGADVNATNQDGNTPLHVAAFMCRADIVKLLLAKGASPHTKNGRGETAVDVVSGEWTKGLADFYTWIGNAVGFELDLNRIQRVRPRMAKLLKEHADATRQPTDGAKP